MSFADWIDLASDVFVIVATTALCIYLVLDHHRYKREMARKEGER